MRFPLICAMALPALANPVLDRRVLVPPCDSPAYNILRLLPVASSFCSGYLKIPISTVVASTATKYIATTTVTVSTFTTTVATTTITVAPESPVKVRNAQPEDLEGRAIPLPLPLLAFAASEISSACSCVSVTPARTTVTATKTATFTVSATATASVTATVTITNPTGCQEQAVYTAAAGEVFREYCNCDWPNNDITYHPGTDLPSCIEDCQAYNVAMTAGSQVCVGVALAYNTNPTEINCFLKHTQDGVCAPNVYYVESAQVVS